MSVQVYQAAPESIVVNALNSTIVEIAPQGDDYVRVSALTEGQSALSRDEAVELAKAILRIANR